MLALTECAASSCAARLRSWAAFLLLQFGNRRVHLINLFIELIERVLRFAQLTVASEISFFPAFQLCEQACSVVVAGVPRALSRRYRPE